MAIRPDDPTYGRRLEPIAALLGHNCRRPLGPPPGGSGAAVRASLMGSQLTGLAFARYVVGVEPLARMTTQQLIGWYAPVLQHYLTASSPSDAVARGLTPERRSLSAVPCWCQVR